jgi:hypothetical protein
MTRSNANRADRSSASDDQARRRQKPFAETLHPDVTMPGWSPGLTRVVEEYRVWLKTDEQGSWLALHEDPRAERSWILAELWGTYPTREEALSAIWCGTRELQALRIDRRKQGRRRWGRPWADRRASFDSLVWTLVE